MKFIASVLFSGLLAGALMAQDKPPADPPPGDPPPADPPPVVEGTEWAKTWQGARDIAAKKNGYALMFVTMDKKKNGEEAPHTSRLLNTFFGLAQTYHELNDNFGCWKGTLAEARVMGAKHLTDANVTEAPAVLFVNPEDGELVDAYVGRCTYLELTDVYRAVIDGNHRKGLEKKLADKANQSDPYLQYLYGEAMLRTGDTKEARKAFAVGKNAKAEGPTMRAHYESMVGLVWCDFKDKKYKEAIEGAEKVLAELPEMAPPRGACYYIQMWSYYLLNEMDECSKIALVLREKAIRTTFGWKMLDDEVDIGYDFVRKIKFTPGEQPPPEEAQPEEMK